MPVARRLVNHSRLINPGYLHGATQERIHKISTEGMVGVFFFLLFGSPSASINKASYYSFRQHGEVELARLHFRYGDNWISIH